MCIYILHLENGILWYNGKLCPMVIIVTRDSILLWNTVNWKCMNFSIALKIVQNNRGGNFMKRYMYIAIIKLLSFQHHRKFIYKPFIFFKKNCIFVLITTNLSQNIYQLRHRPVLFCIKCPYWNSSNEVRVDLNIKMGWSCFNRKKKKK